jgi:hypothetical protein
MGIPSVVFLRAIDITVEEKTWRRAGTFGRRKKKWSVCSVKKIQKRILNEQFQLLLNVSGTICELMALIRNLNRSKLVFLTVG